MGLAKYINDKNSRPIVFVWTEYFISNNSNECRHRSEAVSMHHLNGTQSMEVDEGADIKRLISLTW